jgi:hypothetical protein
LGRVLNLVRGFLRIVFLGEDGDDDDGRDDDDGVVDG